MSDIANLKLLKEGIECGAVPSQFKIFKYEDNPFLAYQYAREIAKVKHLPVEYVDSFDSIIDSLDNAFSFDESSESLKVYACDNFECEQSVDLTKIDNVIVICHKTPIENAFVFSFPKLEDWQILAYMKSQCPGLKDAEIQWLFDITSNIGKNHENIYRLDNEIKKINCFDRSEQEEVFKEISESGGYNDLSPLTIFNFTNAIIKKDRLTIMKVFDDIDSIDIEGVGLITVLHKNFKQLIDIQMGKNPTPESLGMSLKQFKAIEYNCGKFTSDKLVKIFKFLTNLDYKLKSGQLDMSNARMIDYIVCTIFSI